MMRLPAVTSGCMPPQVPVRMMTLAPARHRLSKAMAAPPQPTPWEVTATSTPL